MKRFLLALVASALIAGSAFAAVGYTAKFINASAVGGVFKVDIYLLRTGTTTMRLGNANFNFTYNSAALSSPSVSVNGVFDTLTTNDYGPVTLTTGIFNAQPYVSYNVFFDGLGDNGQGVNPGNTTNGSFVATIQFTITNSAATSNFTWLSGGYAVTNDIGSSLTASGDWTSGNMTSTPLPVELVSFAAAAQGRTVDLTWGTKTEVNNYGFEVQRMTSAPNAAWEKVGFIDGKGTTNTPQNYSFRDVVTSAGVYNYRLKQTDRDGKFVYSAQVEAKTTLSAEDYKLSNNYPNPFNPSTKFNFAVKSTQHVAVKVFNNLGQEVVTLFDGVVPADQIQEVTFDGARLASGIYFYVLRAQDRVEVKKMLMMK